MPSPERPEERIQAAPHVALKPPSPLVYLWKLRRRRAAGACVLAPGYAPSQAPAAYSFFHCYLLGILFACDRSPTRFKWLTVGQGKHRWVWVVGTHKGRWGAQQGEGWVFSMRGTWVLTVVVTCVGRTHRRVEGDRTPLDGADGRDAGGSCAKSGVRVRRAKRREAVC